MEMIKHSVIAGEKFLIDGNEFLRIDGVWFENREEYKYYPVDRPDLEKQYKTEFSHLAKMEFDEFRQRCLDGVGWISDELRKELLEKHNIDVDLEYELAIKEEYELYLRQ